MKLAQRKMLGIANPGLVSVDELKNRSTNFKGKSKSHYTNCKFCGCSHNRGDCPAFGQTCHRCGDRNHFESKCRSEKGSSKSESGHDSRKLSKAKGKCSHNCRFHEVNEECHDDMEDLNEQVQSLFYAKKLLVKDNGR